jgi:hypothetical protein
MSKFASHMTETGHAMSLGSAPSSPESEEERIVAELELLDVGYLSRFYPSAAAA